MITQTNLNRFFDELAKSVDITDARYEKVEKRYKAILDFFKNNELKRYDLDLYPQGSFAMGTAIKPINDDGYYDVDIICRLSDANANKKEMKQSELKALVGNAVKHYCTSLQISKKPVEKAKCWTIEYSEPEQFQMDIVPAISNSESLRILLEKQAYPIDYHEDAIAITNKDKIGTYDIITDNWEISNPKGYLKWFKAILKPYIVKLAEERNVNIEDLPPNQSKTNLHKIIQIMKYHRDFTVGENKHKPISLIITTIAAQNYNSDQNIYSNLVSISDKLIIAGNSGIIINPSNLTENFAESWNSTPEKKELFIKWATRLRDDMLYAKEADIMDSLKDKFNSSFGERIIKEAFEKISYYPPPKVEIQKKPLGPWGI